MAGMPFLTIMTQPQPFKLHLGCQNNYLPGYVNVDLPSDNQTVEKVRADVYADVRDLSYHDNTVDEVRAHHLLEHFSRAQALVLLSRWHRWLKRDGLLMVETPDFEGAMRKFFTSPLPDRFALGRHIFGSQEALWAYHLDFWYEDKFRFVLSHLGYGEFRFEKFSNNLEQKMRSEEHHV
jgi:predicted SAM-dependent methyltransferase